MKKISILSTVVGIAAVFSIVTPAMGQNLNVNAIIGKSCTAPSNYTVTLPDYDGTDRSASATITFKCTSNTRFTIDLFPGNSRVRSSNGTLKSADPGNTTPIAYTVQSQGSSVSRFTGRGSGLSAGAALVGATPEIHPTAGQDPEPGSYSDTIGIVVTY